ncbi:WbqC family protein [Candidatus Omnitrophota bacterium]
MIVSVHQPHYLPWLGYFDKIDCADIFVLLDNVQYEIRGWQNRNNIKTSNGAHMLTIPVRHEFDSTIGDVSIDTTRRWAKKHMNTIRMSYSKAPYFSSYVTFLEDIYSRTWENLADITKEMLGFFVAELGISTEILTASEMGELPEEPNERIARIVAQTGGDVYLSGSGAREYYCNEPFEKEGVSVVFQDFETVPYEQLYGDFIPGMAVIDSLFNLGGKGTLETIRKGRRTVL